MDFELVEKSMEKYNVLDNILQDIFNTKTEIYYAFGTTEEQVIESLKKQGANVDELVSIGYGGYIHKSHIPVYNNVCKYIIDTKKEFCKDWYNICGVYLDRLWDYEARISWGDGYDETLKDVENYVGTPVKDFHKELLIMLRKTEVYYNKKFDELN